MDNFTYSTRDILGHTFHVYTGDSRRGGQDQIFFVHNPPAGKIYVNKWHAGQEDERDLTWDKEVESIPEFSELGMRVVICTTENNIQVLFTRVLSTEEETALDAAYDNHVGPVDAAS